MKKLFVLLACMAIAGNVSFVVVDVSKDDVTWLTLGSIISASLAFAGIMFVLMEEREPKP